VHWAPGIPRALSDLRADDFLDNLGRNMPRERKVMSATELATVIARLIVQGVSDFVQINLNRFTSLPGYFNSAHEARQTHVHRGSGLSLVWHGAAQNIAGATWRGRPAPSSAGRRRPSDARPGGADANQAACACSRCTIVVGAAATRASDASAPLCKLRSLVSEFDNWKAPIAPG
jgi:hypothetical protein